MLTGVILRWMLAMWITSVRGRGEERISCSMTDQVRHYPMGTSQQTLEISLETFLPPREDPRQPNSSSSLSISTPCRVTLMGCDDCRFDVKVTVVDWEGDTAGCRDSGSHLKNTETTLPTYPTKASLKGRTSYCDANCSYIHLYEPGYENLSLVPVPNNNTSSTLFASLSSRVTMETCVYISSSAVTSPRVVLEVTTQKKLEVFTGSPTSNSRGSFTSPYFPAGYARQGEKYSYLIENIKDGGSITVDFEDWDISQNTRLLFYDVTNGTQHLLSIHYGYYFRPVTQTASSRLLVEFEPDIASSPSLVTSRYSGFRASYTFHSENDKHHSPYEIETDCGGHIRYIHGGSILYSASYWTSGRIHDCLWVLHKSNTFQHIQLNIWNTSFAALDVSVDVRDGLTSLQSTSYRFSSLNMTSSWHSHKQESTVSVLGSDEGFYVRLKGTVFQDDNFFVTFISYNDPSNDTTDIRCSRKTDFYCSTNSGGICIDDNFLCDGHAHCPGGQDESVVCNNAHVEPDTAHRAAIYDRDCVRGDFRCISGDRCVPREVVCDGRQDCRDGSDEFFCDVYIHNDNHGTTRCHNGSRLCVNSCVPEAEVCLNEHCAYLWYKVGCELPGSKQSRFRIQWSLILPLCFAIFCVFILLGIVVIRVRKQPKVYMDPNCHSRRCRRVPLVPRVIRSFAGHGHCTEAGNCSATSSVGLLSCSTSFSGGSMAEQRQYLQSPTFELCLSPTGQQASPSASVTSREMTPYFNFEQFQTSVT